MLEDLENDFLGSKDSDTTYIERFMEVWLISSTFWQFVQKPEVSFSLYTIVFTFTR